MVDASFRSPVLPGDAPDRFPKDCWYVAARSTEVGRALLKRTIACENLVFYRTEGGRAVALLDMCPHRLAPLSLGKLVGDAVECGYHGIVFDCEGRCIRIPGEDGVAGRFRVKRFPLAEKWGFVWVWLGDAEKADDALLPQYFRWQDEPGWCPMEDYIHLKADYRLVIDNLLDLSHEAFLHTNTIGNAAVADTPAVTTISGDSVEVKRFMENCAPPKLFVRAAGFTTNIDRHQRIVFVPPCFVIIEVRAVATGTDDLEHGLIWWVLNALTPETAGSTHYFWGLPRKFKQDDKEITELLRSGVTRTFEEDRIMLEAQQQNIERVPLEQRTLYARSDQAPARARSIIAALLEREVSGRGAGASAS